MTETQTNKLRALVEARLNGIKTAFNIAEISYREATDDALFPHLVFLFSNIAPTDHGREDYTLDVHVWAKDNHTAWEIGDTVAGLFTYYNAPGPDILPTFYEANVGQVEDTDHDIAHVVVRIQAQTYTRNGGFEWQH